MEEITVTGRISKSATNYVIITDEGKEYPLSAILPWEAVSADYGTDEFELHVGKRMKATGVTDSHTIYRVTLHSAVLDKRST